MKSFAYEERFRDIVTIDSFDRAVRRFYGMAIDKIAGTLTDEDRDGMLAGQVTATIRAEFDPLLNKYLGALRREGPRRFFGDPVIKDELESLLDTGAIAARVVAVVPPPRGTGADMWRQTIVNAVNDAMACLTSEEELMEEVSGAYGFRMFDDYDFAIDASLPGTLVESNATSHEADVLKWTFTPDEFAFDDYVLRARSRIIYPQRIALAAAVLVGFPLGWWLVRRRTTAERSAG